jgi:4-hydroxy-3-methylbut-2-enyl diphosphate reductase
MGQIDGRVHLISSASEVAAIEPADPDQLAFVTQTTLSVDDTREVIDALRVRFPNIVGPDTRDICYATQNRQTAVRALAREVDVILVVGARNSSNSNRLREIGAATGTPSYLLDSADRLEARWLDGARAVGITAGASAPELLVQNLIDRLGLDYDVRVETLAGIAENVHFRLPPELDGSSSRAGAA